MKTNQNGFQNALLLTVVPLVAFLASFVSTGAFADGCFVVPKFVWDQYKDINEPAQKAIIVYDAGHEDLILQVKYGGPVDQFGWLIPVPAVPEVKKCSMKCFYELSQYVQEHLGEGWGPTATVRFSAGAKNSGRSEPPVEVIETRTAGDYKIAVLSTRDAGALERWLTTNSFTFPKGKTDILNSYINRHWYFVAVKINSRSLATPRDPTDTRSLLVRMANGELNPLHIGFATRECVFPLKISSVNNAPSEVQVYLMSRHPLMEEGYPIETAKLRQDWESDRKELQKESTLNFPRKRRVFFQFQFNLPAKLTDPSVVHWRLVPFAQVARSNLTECAEEIPTLQSGTWWLVKRSWTFQPEEMQDLKFLPAASVFAERFGTDDGAGAAESLGRLGADAVPAVAAALESTNSMIRFQAAWAFRRFHFYDPVLTKAANHMLTDENPGVRSAAEDYLNRY